MSFVKKLNDPDLNIMDALRRIKLIYSDLDGSMLGPGGNFFIDAEKQPTLVPAKGLIALREAGVEISLISGRSASQLREISRLLGLKSYITEVGCQIVDDQGTYIKAYDFNHDDSTTLHEAIEKSGAPKLLLNAFAERLEYHTPWSNNRLCTHLFRGEVDVEKANKLLSDEGFGSLKLADNGVVRSRGKLKDVSEIHAYHLLPANSGKAEAIKYDQKIRGISKEETAAIGDSPADLFMADEVGLFFLIQNNDDLDLSNDSDLSKDNVYITSLKMGHGWAEVANLIAGSHQSISS